MAFSSERNSPASQSSIVLIAFLAVSLVCMLVYFREGDEGPIHSVQEAVSSAFAPVQNVGTVIGAGVESAKDNIEDATTKGETVQDLRDEVEELREQLSQMEEYRQEIERLQGLLDMKGRYAIDGIPAQVVGRSADTWNKTVTINVGSDDGVSAGLTVMGPSGVVGQVVSVSPTVSQVRLITDPQSGIAVLIQSNRKEGICRGSLDGMLYLENIDANANIQIGDVVVTSGLGGSYTRGLIVGTVVKVDESQGLASRTIMVSPNESTGPLQEVIVVRGLGSQGAAA